jgi:hypothetical protein
VVKSRFISVRFEAHYCTTADIRAQIRDGLLLVWYPVRQRPVHFPAGSFQLRQSAKLHEYGSSPQL